MQGRKTSPSKDAQRPWVLSLDADEELTTELQNEIKQLLENDAITLPQVEGYRLRRRNIFLGRWMRHGGFYPDLKVRLFRLQTGTSAPRFTERLVHESIPTAGDGRNVEA